MMRQSQAIAMPATLKDIARESGLDASTVSRALSGGYGVREKTREKVLAIAEKLNYHPNLMARGLVTGRSHTIGLLISDIRNPYFADVVRGAEDAAYAAGHDIVLCNSDLDPVKQMKYFRSLREKRVSGILTSSVAALNRSEIDELASFGVPIVVFDETRRPRDLSTVLADNFQGGELAGKYLKGLGHSVIAHLTGPREVGNLAQRCAGFVKALKSSPNGVAPIVIRGRQTYRGGHEMANKLFSRRPRVTAIFAANDITAFGVLQAVLEKGMAVPDDVSLIGFDNVQLAGITHPPLTTVEQPKYEMGQAGVEIVLRQLKGHGEHVPEHRRFGVRLIERKSCRAR